MTDRKGGGDGPRPDYPALIVESNASIETGLSSARVRAGLRKRKNWEQLAKFCVVGVTGYAVNLVVFASLVQGFSFHYIPAAMASFLVAVTNNYLWNRQWTFRGQRGHVGAQGARFLVVSLLALGANLLCLHILIGFGLGKFVAQAIAIVVVTPVNFIGNKLWSFRVHRT